MKKTLFALTAILIGFTSCDSVDDLKTKDFNDIELSSQTLITVTEPENQSVKMDEDYSFTKEVNLDFNDISELKDYLNKLEDVDVNSVTCKLTNVTGGEVISLQISVPDLNYEVEIPSVVPNQDLSVNFTTEQLNTISNELLQYKKLKVIISGTVSDRPLSFTIETTALLDVEVEIL